MESGRSSDVLEENDHFFNKADPALEFLVAEDSNRRSFKR
jgi:hypothetical protein